MGSNRGIRNLVLDRGFVIVGLGRHRNQAYFAFRHCHAATGNNHCSVQPLSLRTRPHLHHTHVGIEVGEVPERRPSMKYRQSPTITGTVICQRKAAIVPESVAEPRRRRRGPVQLSPSDQCPIRRDSLAAGTGPCRTRPLAGGCALDFVSPGSGTQIDRCRYFRQSYETGKAHPQVRAGTDALSSEEPARPVFGTLGRALRIDPGV